MKFKILIVDDDPIFLYVQNRIISELTSKNEIISFENGKLALNYLVQNNEPLTTYFVFLDIDMPIMSGWEFMDAIDKYGVNYNLTIAILTSSLDKYDIEMAQNYSEIVAYIQKPLYRKNLNGIPQIRNFLENLEME